MVATFEQLLQALWGTIPWRILDLQPANALNRGSLESLWNLKPEGKILLRWTHGWTSENASQPKQQHHLQTKCWRRHVQDSSRIAYEYCTIPQHIGEQLSHSRHILSHYGNMSSATILFILEHMRQHGCHGPFVSLAFGPGLCAEVALMTL